MKLNLKEYFKLSILYTVVAAFPSLLQVIIQPIMEGKSRLNAVDFSQIAITESITSFAFILIVFSLTSAMARFYYDYINDSKGYKGLVSSIFNSILFNGLIAIIIAFIFSDYIGRLFSQDALKDFSKYGYICIIIAINRAIYTTAFVLYRNEKKVYLFLFTNIALGILRIAFQLIGIFYFDMSFIGYLYGSCLGSSLVTIFILSNAYLSCGVRFNTKILKNIYKFAFPLFISSILSWGLLYFDRFFLEDHPKDLGIYDLAMKLAIGIQLILQGLGAASQPELYGFMQDGISKNMENIKKLSNLLLAQTQVIIALAIIPTMIFLSFFFETELKESSGLISIVFLRFIISMQYSIFCMPVYFMKRTKIFLFTDSIVLFINCVLNYMLIPYYGYYGAIITAFISQIIQLLLIFYFQNKIIKINWNLRKILINPLVIIFIAFFIEYFKNVFHINSFLTSTFITFLVLFNIIFLYKNEIRIIYLTYLNKFISYVK